MEVGEEDSNLKRRFEEGKKNGLFKPFFGVQILLPLNISKEKTMEYIDKLPCETEKKVYMKSLIMQ